MPFLSLTGILEHSEKMCFKRFLAVMVGGTFSQTYLKLLKNIIYVFLAIIPLLFYFNENIRDQKINCNSFFNPGSWKHYPGSWKHVSNPGNIPGNIPMFPGIPETLGNIFREYRNIVSITGNIGNIRQMFRVSWNITRHHRKQLKHEKQKNSNRKH